jgi:hypothetical protein
MGTDVGSLVFFVFAFVCFVLASFPIAAPYHPRLVAAGLAFFMAGLIFTNGIRAFGH